MGRRLQESSLLSIIRENTRSFVGRLVGSSFVSRYHTGDGLSFSIKINGTIKISDG